MRYLETTFMKRTFELANKRLGLKMLPYLRANDNAFLSYNGITITKAVNNEKGLSNEDVFNVSIGNGGNVPEEYSKQGTGVFCTRSSAT